MTLFQRGGSSVKRGISTLVDAATERAEQAASTASDIAAPLAQESVKRVTHVAKEIAPVALPIVAKQAKKARRSRRAKHRDRRAEQHSSGGGRMKLFVVLGLGTIVAAVVVVRRRRAAERDAVYATPDAFGAAVEAERNAMGNGAPRPVATPGA
jgi:hypothetical protein